MKLARKSISLILCFFIIIMSLCACGDNSYDENGLKTSKFLKSDSNDDYTYDVYEDYTIITAYIGEDFRVSIPSRLGGKPVKGIGENAIGSSMLAIDIVDIPKSVVDIDPSAFSDSTTITIFTVASGNPVYKSEKGVMYSKDGKTLLHYPSGKLEEKYTVSNTVQKIGDYAFSNCEDLYSVTLPETITEIGAYAFSGCDKLNKVNIPESVTAIGSHAFYECQALPEVTLPSKLKTIGDHAFDYCISIKKLTVPDSVVEIGDGAFMRCESLSELTLPSGLQKYGYQVCSGCMLLKEFKISSGNKKFRVSDGVLYSYDGTELVDFPYGRYERKVTIADGVKTIRAYAFYRDYQGYEEDNDDNIESVDFNDVEKIGAYAFANRDAIKVVILPSVLKELSVTAFNHCMGITEYRITDNPLYQAVDGVLFSADKKTLIAYPAGSKTLSYTIPEGTEHIGDYAFSYSMNLNELNMAKTIKTVGNYGFYQASAFTTPVVFSDALESLGEYCFSHCMGVEEFNIPANTITVIPKGAFEVIDGAYEFVIPEGVTEIGEEAFRESGYLAYIEIPSTVTKIGDRAFYDMDDLHKLTIPSTVTQFGEDIVSVYDVSDPDKVTLYVDEGSKALEYAQNNNVPYEINKQ